MSQDSQGVRMWPAPWQQRSHSVELIQRVLLLHGLWMWGHLGSAVVLRYRAVALPQPWDMGAVSLAHQRMSCQAGPGTGDPGIGEKLKHPPAQVVLCCSGWLQGWNGMRESQPEQVKPSRSLFGMGLVWLVCRRQDFRACIVHEGGIAFIWCLLASRSVTWH